MNDTLLAPDILWRRDTMLPRCSHLVGSQTARRNFYRGARRRVTARTLCLEGAPQKPIGHRPIGNGRTKMTHSTTRSMRRLFPIAALCAMAATSAHADATNRCARDYAPVAGSNGCVRLGGHVRVELGRNHPAAPTLPPMSYVAQDGFQAASTRFAQQPAAPFELFRR